MLADNAQSKQHQSQLTRSKVKFEDNAFISTVNGPHKRILGAASGEVLTCWSTRERIDQFADRAVSSTPPIEVSRWKDISGADQSKLRHYADTEVKYGVERKVCK